MSGASLPSNNYSNRTLPQSTPQTGRLGGKNVARNTNSHSLSTNDSPLTSTTRPTASTAVPAPITPSNPSPSRSSEESTSVKLEFVDVDHLEEFDERAGDIGVVDVDMEHMGSKPRKGMSNTFSQLDSDTTRLNHSRGRVPDSGSGIQLKFETQSK